MLLAALLLAQTAAPACPAEGAPPPAAFASWATPETQLAPGKAVVLQAGPLAALKEVPGTPEPGGAVATGFTIATAGSYAIALDQPGWIDVVGSDGKALATSGHRHGPACSGIRKIVQFRLAPGTYRLFLTGLASPTAKVMLAAGD